MDNNNDFNPEDFAPIPADLLPDNELDYLREATEEEQLIQYAEEEEVVDTTSKFLNIDGAEFGQQIFNALKEGHLDPIRTLLMLKKMSNVHEYFLGSTAGKFNKEAKEYIRDKVAEIIGKETFQAYGASIAIQAVGGANTMNYTECGDIYLNRLYELEKEIKTLITERQNFIKTNLPAESKTLGIRTLQDKPNFLPKLTFVTNDKSCNIVPPIKISRDGIVVRFAKKKK